MTGFSAEWLDCREPVDHAARSDVILSAISHYFLSEDQLSITDIGCGTGSTLRALKPFLNQKLKWVLIDNDPELLKVAQQSAQRDEVQFGTADLSKDLSEIFKVETSLLTTSAFLDLVSEEWLQGFVSEVCQHKVPFYAALSYDGRAELTPAHASDVDILAAFNQHQKTDKGFGTSLGPDAVNAAIDMFRKAGYAVISEESDWVARDNHFKFQEMLLEGWHGAACETLPEHRDEFDAWMAFRREAIASGSHQTTVGHVDFFATPA